METRKYYISKRAFERLRIGYASDIYERMKKEETLQGLSDEECRERIQSESQELVVKNLFEETEAVAKCFESSEE